jgi:hypothetical protein
MLKLAQEALIDAPAGTVFDVITDLPRYAEWNPWILKAVGTPSEGATIRVRSLVGGRLMRVDHRILRSKPDTEFRWCDLGWFTRLAYGERARWLEPRGEGKVSYRVELTITGVLAPVVKAVLGRSLAWGLEAETRELKQRAETLAARVS